MYHKPVLLHEAIKGLDIRPDGIYVDVTFGGGGHSRAILSQLADSGRLIAFDQDQDAQSNVPDDKRFTLLPVNFRRLEDSLKEIGIDQVDGLLADLGVSSHQFDESSRGFSIRFDAVLDMRMDRAQTLTARDVINYYPEEALERIFRQYGELDHPRRVARAVVQAREVSFISTGQELKDAVSRCVIRNKENTFYAQLFQALRIEVNDELSALRELLVQASSLIRAGGRLVVISYHSLEDRLVKNLINTGNLEGELHKDFFGHTTGLLFAAVTRKPVVPSAEELELNPRSRSAKMRIAIRK
ncbi:MAG: 16S rRNA (cytosine(1402)-N(4))-methyltransferase RsmH [Sphingobacteriales bacterium]|jgi:16S rRNA (cytosine1402-N4)-methyltransferase|nr:16S rRNA (cytosine(1402)-N(4))-methyltransferase RsmH [Sphingobacteriales bacterium]